MKRVIAVAVLAMLAGCAAPVERNGEAWRSEWCQPVMTKDAEGNMWLVVTGSKGNVVGVVTKEGNCAVGGSGLHLDLATRAMVLKMQETLDAMEKRDDRAVRAK